MEERGRSAEVQLAARQRKVEEADRDVSREAARQRGEELRAIESLRRAIALRSAEMGGTA
jgi:hypothetical protein